MTKLAINIKSREISKIVNLDGADKGLFFLRKHRDKHE
jgi:hypothetical protein